MANSKVTTTSVSFSPDGKRVISSGSKDQDNLQLARSDKKSGVTLGEMVSSCFYFLSNSPSCQAMLP